MSKPAGKLPYFRWWVDDAEGDEVYRSLNDAELGFYHRCLNSAWRNNGLPADLDELASLFRVTRKYLDTVWPRVSKKWQERNGRLYNRKQEEERRHARTKSRKATDSVRTRYERRADVPTNELLRAPAHADSVSVSESSPGLNFRKTPLELPKRETPSERFDEFWERWPRKSGKDAAAIAWNSYVTQENESKVFACLERFLASGDAARGAIPYAGPSPGKPGWLADCARDSWECDWPKARDSPPAFKSRQQMLVDAIDRL